MLYKDDNTQLNYYSMETIQKLIDFQFIKTKKFLVAHQPPWGAKKLLRAQF